MKETLEVISTIALILLGIAIAVSIGIFFMFSYGDYQEYNICSECDYRDEFEFYRYHSYCRYCGAKEIDGWKVKEVVGRYNILWQFEELK